MERRAFLKTLGCASLSLLTQGCLGPRTRSDLPKQPNILFIFTDDHAVQSISAYGSKINKTPQIDRLADEGMIFDRCFCCNSICAPSRAAILTGKHSHANGQTMNGIVFDGSQTTFPKRLRQAGYQTALIGKWHLRSDPTGFVLHLLKIGFRTLLAEAKTALVLDQICADVAGHDQDHVLEVDDPAKAVCQRPHNPVYTRQDNFGRSDPAEWTFFRPMTNGSFAPFFFLRGRMLSRMLWTGATGPTGTSGVTPPLLDGESQSGMHWPA